MKIVAGMISAPRPVETVVKCAESLEESICLPWVYRDGPPVPDPGRCYFAKDSCDARQSFSKSERGCLGNFQNWIQTARQILHHCNWIGSLASTGPSHLGTVTNYEAILLAEDDALFAPGIYDLLQRDLWPSLDCGVVSLYCPNMSQYSTANRGLNQTRITSGKKLTTAGNLVGALALVFPRSVLQEIVYHPSVETWRGSHAQAANPNTKPWERKAVDTWIGQVLKEMGKTAWHYSPSLVYHYSPDPKVANSSLGHGLSNRNRQARSWVGEKPQDLLKLMKPLKERYDIPCANLPEHQV